MKYSRRSGRWLLLCLLVLIALPVWLFWPKAIQPEPLVYIRAKAEELEFKRERLVAFVKDETQRQQYDGIQRGAIGTLWAGAGSDEDRASLLAALLRVSGETVRFASNDETLWVQIRESGTWNDVGINDAQTLGTATWTGTELPDEVFNTLQVTVEVAADDRKDTKSTTVRTAELVHHPLVLRRSLVRIAGDELISPPKPSPSPE